MESKHPAQYLDSGLFIRNSLCSISYAEFWGLTALKMRSKNIDYRYMLF